MSFARTNYSLDSNPQWRFSFRNVDEVYGGVLASGNGTVAFGKVKNGTVLGRLATNKLRPCGWSRVTAVGTTTNDVTVGNTAGFFVGDAVDVGDLSAGGTVVAGRNVTAIDRDTGVITLDGATFDVAIGDELRLADGWQPAGILDRAERTTVDIDGTTVEQETSCKYATSGDAIPSKLTGYDAVMASALTAGPFADIVNGTSEGPLSFVLREI